MQKCGGNEQTDIDETKLASTIHNLAEVVSVNYNNDTVKFTYRTNKEHSEKIKKMVEKN